MSKRKKPVYDPIAIQKSQSRAMNGSPPPTRLVPDKHKLRELMPKHKVPDWKRASEPD